MRFDNDWEEESTNFQSCPIMAHTYDPDNPVTGSFRSNTTAKASASSMPSHNLARNELISPLDILYHPHSHVELLSQKFLGSDQALCQDLGTSSVDLGIEDQDPVAFEQGLIPYGDESSTASIEDNNCLAGSNHHDRGTVDQTTQMITSCVENLVEYHNSNLDLIVPTLSQDSTSSSFYSITGNNDSNLARSTGNTFTETTEKLSRSRPASRQRSVSVKHLQGSEYEGSGSTDTRTCLDSALFMLQELHVPSQKCSRGFERIPSHVKHCQPRMIDDVLSFNKEVVLMASNMLKCTCSLRPLTHLVLAIICGKVMAWYEAIIRGDDLGNSLSSTTSAHEKCSPDHSRTERVLQQPISVGRYSFDQVLDHQMRSQIVRNELQYLEAVVESLCRRISGVTSGTSTACPCPNISTFNVSFNRLREAGMDHPEAVRQNMITFLLRRLAITKEMSSIIDG